MASNKIDVDDLEAEAAQAAAAVPTEASSARLRAMAQEVLDTDARVGMLEAELRAAKERRTQLVHVEMPALMSEIGQDKIGIPGWGEAGADLVLEPYYKANIGAEWEPERQEAAYDHLDYLGAGDIVKSVVSFQFDRGSDALQRAFLDEVTSLDFEDRVLERVRAIDPGRNDASVPPATRRRSVPWGTLTAFVREWTQAAGSRGPGDPVMDLEKIGAVVGSVVKIKSRKVR